jgi:hypothetical protein
MRLIDSEVMQGVHTHAGIGLRAEKWRAPSIQLVVKDLARGSTQVDPGHPGENIPEGYLVDWVHTQPKAWPCVGGYGPHAPNSAAWPAYA